MRPIAAMLLAAMTLLAPALAARAATVHSVDGSEAEGQQIALADGKLSLLDDGGKSLGAWDVVDLARVEIHAAPEPPEAAEDTAAFSRVAIVGGTVRAALASFDGRAFILSGGDLGLTKLPLACVRGIVFSGEVPLDMLDAAPPSDILVMTNGDRVSGTLNAIGPESVSFHSDLGDLEPQRSRVAAVVLAAPPGGRPELPRPAIAAHLHAESHLSLGSVTVADGNLSGTVPGGPDIVLPLARVGALDIVGGRLAFLDTLEPETYEQGSQSVLRWQVVPQANVLGEPMRLAVKAGEPAVEFQRGIGVHGPCRVVYRLGGQYERFIALVGIDASAGRWADAVIAVKVDGKDVFRAEGLSWRQPAREVNISVQSAKTLELIVEMGEHFDVQDRINWADARLLRAADR